MTRTIRMPECHCPHCGKLIDAAISLDSSSPSPGDISICWGCAKILQFDQQLHLAVLSDAELAQMQQDEPECYAQLQQAVAMVKEERGIGR